MPGVFSVTNALVGEAKTFGSPRRKYPAAPPRQLAVMIAYLRILPFIHQQVDVLHADLPIDRRGFQAVQQVVSQHAEEPCLGSLDDLALAARNEVAKEDFLHRVLGRFMVPN